MNGSQKGVFILTFAFVLTRPSFWHQYFLHCDLDLRVLLTFWKLTLALVRDRAFYFDICVFLVTHLFKTRICNFDLDICPTLYNFILSSNYWMASDRAFYISNMFSCRPFLLSLEFFYFVTLTLAFDILYKSLNLGHNF